MKLSMIDFASSLFEEEQLKDCYIIGVQHILPSTYTMFKALVKKGLKKSNISLLGKCYSTDHEIFNEMIENGFDVCELSIQFDSHENYDFAFKKKIHKFLSKRKHIFNSSKYKKIIIIDDGGELLEEIENYIDDFSKVVAIEQTSSGYNRLIEKELPCPIINLARSSAKLTIEYPRVINNALKKINKLIDNSKCLVRNILILGNGKMGTCLFEALKEKYKVLRYDKNKKNSDLNEKELTKALSETDLIIGCTGTVALKKEKHKYLKKDSILISLSSSDREFDTVYLRKKSPQTHNPWINNICSSITLANNGFPISFDNNDMDDSSFFQFTRSLIMSSIYQALNIKNVKGFVELDKDLQKQMIEKFQKKNIQKNFLENINL